MPTTYTEPRSDAYTGLLAISLGAMVLSSIILWADFAQYPTAKPPAPPTPKLRAPTQEGQPAGAPAGVPAEAPDAAKEK